MVLEFKGAVNEHELMKWARGRVKHPSEKNTVVLDVQTKVTWGTKKVIATSILRMPGYGDAPLAAKRLA